MVAIVAGSGLGLFNASPNILGAAAVLGQSSLGQAAGRCYVNVATGNLVLRVGDEHLSGRGVGLSHLRTHNSLGTANDGDGDGWRWDGERTVLLQGTVGGAGSSVTRTDGDGHQTVYGWDGSRYSSTEGGGAHDGLVHEPGPQQWVWTDGSSRLVERYSASTGKLASQQDISGNSITFQYDSGRLAGVTDLLSGQKLVLAYETVPGSPNLTRLKRVETVALTVDASGRATSVPGLPVKQVDYAYDADTGRLLSVRTELTPTDTSDNKFYITDYTYDGSSSRIASVSHSDGSRATFGYQNNQVKTVTDASGTQTFSYEVQTDPQGDGDGSLSVTRTHVSVDVGGAPKVWTYVSDSAQRLIEILSPPPTAGAARLSTRFSYETNGNVKQIVDGLGNTMDYEYDGAGNRRLERDTRGNTVVRTFDPRNQVVTETRFGLPDPDGPGQQSAGNPVTTRFAYDTEARLRFTVSAEGAVAENRYGTSGGAKGLLTQTVLYTGGRFGVGGLTPQQGLTELELVTWAGAQDKTQIELTELAYDLRGNLSKQTAFAKTTTAGIGVLDAAAEVTEYIYDAHGDLLKTLVGRGAGRARPTTVSSVERDGLGRVTQSANAGGPGTTVYDDANSKVQVSTAAGLVETRQFDDRGRPVGVTQGGDGASRAAKTVYDAAGRLRMSEDPQGGRRFIFYDAADRIRFTVDTTGAVTGLEYDANSQVKVETRYRNLVANTNSWYDASTNTVTKNSLTVGASGVDVVVDAVNDRVTRYDYDSSNRRTSVTDAVGTASTTGYDGRSLVTQQQTGGRVSRFFYDRDDRQVGVVDPLGFLTEYKFDAAGRLSETIRYRKRSPIAANVAAPAWVGVTNQTAIGGRHFVYPLPAFDSDGDDLVYSLVGTPPSWLTLDTSTGAAVLKGTPPTTITSYSVTVKADDQRTKTANATITITVVNTPPSWTTLTDSTVEVSTGGYSLTMPAAADIESTAAQLTYSLLSPAPAGLTFSAALRRLSGTPTARGVYTLTARVADQQGLFAERSFTLRVTGSKLRWAAVPKQELVAGQPFSMTVPAAEDPDGHPVVYSVVSKPGWLAFNTNTRVLSGTPTSPGFVSVVLQAQDSTGAGVVLSFGLDAAGNSAPAWAQMAPTVMAAGSPANLTPPKAVAAGGRSVTYSAVSGLPEGLSVNSATGVVTGTTLAVGHHRLAVRATDPGGKSTDRTVEIEVERAGQQRAVASVASEPVEDVLAAWRPKETAPLRSYLYYDGQGRVGGSVDELGFLIESVYDAEANTAQKIRYRNPVAVTPTDTLATLKVKAGTAKLTGTVEYDDFCRVRRLVDADGTVTSSEYDNAGRLVRQVRGVGSDEPRARRTRLTAFGEANGTLGGEGEATLPADPTQPVIDAAIASRGARYEYDNLGRRAKAVNPSNKVTLLFYDSENRLTHTINAEREVVETRYDANGQVASVRGYATRMTPPNMTGLTGGPATQLAGKLPAVDTAKDQLTTFEYDRRGLLTKQTDAEGFITNRTYNQFGQVETETRTISTGLGGTRSVTTRFDYDLRGGLLSKTADVGGIGLNQRTSYDGQGRPVRSVDGAGKVTTSAVENGGRAIEVTDPLGRTTRSEYDVLGRVSLQVDPSQQVTRFDYNDAVRTATVTSAENARVTTRKTRHGEIAEVTDALSGTTRYQYNKDGQLLTVIDATNATIRENTYDASGRLETTKDGRGMLVRLFYDDVDRVRERRVESDNNVTTAYQFNAFGQNATVTEGKGTSAELVTSYDYDRNGRLLQVVVDPSGLKLSTKYSYDGLGNAVTIQHGTVDSPAQQVTTYEFDNLGRKTKQIDAPSAVLGKGAPGTRDLTTHYRYDAAGRLSRVIDAAGESAWTVYDAAGQATHMINAEGEVSESTYDLNGRLIKTRRYLNRLSAAVLAGLGDVVGPVAPAVDANDQRSILVYNRDGRLRFTLTAAQGDKWVVGENRFDANGNITETRRYDQFLPEASITALDTTASPGLSVAEVNAELTALGYGGEETLTLIQRTRFAFHANNRLRFTVDALGAVSENVYDPMGSLVAAVRYAVKPTLSDYNQNAISAAVDRTNPGNRVTRFAYDTQGRLRFTLRVAASDNQGKATQHVVSEQAYDALGRPAQSMQYATPVGVLADYRPATIATAIAPNAEDRRQVSVYDIAGRQVYSVRVLTPGALGKHQVSKTEYDAIGRATRTTAYAKEVGLANYTKATIDSAVAANVSPHDRTTAFVHDAVGRQRFTVAADGALSETVYDVKGRVTERRSFDVVVAAATPRTEAALTQLRGDRHVGDGVTRGERYSYDRVDRILTTTDAKGFTETNTYSGLGDRTTHKDKNGAICTYHYDRQGRVFRKVTPQVDVFVQLDGQTVPTLQPTTLEDRTYHNALGNLFKTVERFNTADARTTDFDHDTLGRPTSTELPGYFADPNAEGADPAQVGRVYKENATGRFRRTVTFTYDVFGQMVRTQTRTSLVTNQFEYKTYDLLGRVKHDVDALNHLTALAYNSFDEQGEVTRYGMKVKGAPANGSHWTSAEIATQIANEPQATLLPRPIVTRYDNAGRKFEVKQPLANYYHGDSSIRKNSPAAVTVESAHAITTYAHNAFGEVRRESVKVNATDWRNTWRYFDTRGREVRSVDDGAQHIVLSYDAFGNLERTVEHAQPGMSGSDSNLNPPGVGNSDDDRITAFAYDVLNRRQKVRRLGARYTHWNGSAYVDVANGRDVSTDLQTFGYDGAGHVLTQTDALGGVTSFAYNALGQLTQTTEPTRKTAQAGQVDPFVVQGPIVPFVTSTPTVSLTLDAFGNVTRQTRVVGSGPISAAGGTLVVQHEYDAAGNQFRTVDARGNETLRRHDHAGRIDRETVPTSVTFPGTGEHAHPIERRYEYDAAGRQIATLDAFKDVDFFEDRGMKQSGVRSMFNAFGEVFEERRVWGPATVPWVQFLSQAKLASYKYDNAGNLERRQASDGVTVLFYNLAGQVTRQEQRGKSGNLGPATRITETGYDPLGKARIQRLPVFTSHTGSARIVTTPIVEQDYDRWGNVGFRSEGRSVRNDTGALLGNAAVSRYRCNAENQVATEVLPVVTAVRANGSEYQAIPRHELRHDLLGRVVQEIDLSDVHGTPTDEATVLRRRSREYNPAGQLVAETDGTGVTTQYVYDGHGNRLGERDALGTVLVDTFDKNGNVLTHSVLRRPSLTAPPVVHLINQYEYDQANRRFKSGDKVEDLKPLYLSFTEFDERSFAREQRRPSASSTQCDYDVHGNKVRDIDSGGEHQIWTHSAAEYTFGQLATSTEGGRLTTYLYNDFGQLESETHPLGSKSYAYHENGLVRHVREVLTRGIKGSAGEADYWQNDDRSFYDYTERGQLAREEFRRAGEYEIRWPEGDEGSIETVPIEETTRTTYTTYDAHGRMVTVRAPQEENQKRQPLSLTFWYDELGNRRRIEGFVKSDQSDKSDKWYTYDAEGRMAIVDGRLENGEVKQGLGTVVTYDQLGRRATAHSFAGGKHTEIIDGEGRPQVDWHWLEFSLERYGYDRLNHLSSTHRNPIRRDITAGQAVEPRPADSGPERLVETRVYDRRGGLLQVDAFAPDTGAAKTTTTSTYRPDGQLEFQRTVDHVNPGRSSEVDPKYNNNIQPAERLKSYTYKQVGAGTDATPAYTNTYTYFYSSEFSGSKVDAIFVSTTLPLMGAGKTENTYDPSGRLLNQTVGLGLHQFRSSTFAYDIDDLVLSKSELTRTDSFPPQSSGLQDVYYARGRHVAVIGSGSLAKTTQYSNGFTPISAAYPGSSPDSYVVKDGDTLTTIAQLVFGDTALWYLIAEANSLAFGPADELPITERGKTYRIPNVVANFHNHATTFLPYSLADVIGDQTPQPSFAPPPPPPPKGWLTVVLGTAAIIAVVVIVTYATAGLATAALGAFSSGFAAGAVGVGISAGIAAAVGNAAGQWVGMEFGLQDKFSYRSLIAAGVGGLVGGMMIGHMTIDPITKLPRGTDLSSRLMQTYTKWITSNVVDRLTGMPMPSTNPAIGLGLALAGTALGHHTDAALGRPQGTYAPAIAEATNLVGSAVNPHSGWLFNDRSRDWKNILGQALGAFTEVAVGAALKPAANKRAQLRRPALPGSFKDNVAASYGLDPSAVQFIGGSKGSADVMAGTPGGEARRIRREVLLEMSGRDTGSLIGYVGQLLGLTQIGPEEEYLLLDRYTVQIVREFLAGPYRAWENRIEGKTYWTNFFQPELNYEVATIRAPELAKLRVGLLDSKDRFIMNHSDTEIAILIGDTAWLEDLNRQAAELAIQESVRMRVESVRIQVESILFWAAGGPGGGLAWDDDEIEVSVVWDKGAQAYRRESDVGTPFARGGYGKRGILGAAGVATVRALAGAGETLIAGTLEMVNEMDPTYKDRVNRLRRQGETLVTSYDYWQYGAEKAGIDTQSVEYDAGRVAGAVVPIAGAALSLAKGGYNVARSWAAQRETARIETAAAAVSGARAGGLNSERVIDLAEVGLDSGVISPASRPYILNPPGLGQSHYVPRDIRTGEPLPLNVAEHNGILIPVPDPRAPGAHTTIGVRISSQGGYPYRQAASFGESVTWPPAQGLTIPRTPSTLSNRVPEWFYHWSNHAKQSGQYLNPISRSGSPNPLYHPDPHRHAFSFQTVNEYLSRWDTLPAEDLDRLSLINQVLTAGR